MIPFDGFGVILRNTLAGFVKDTQVELRGGIVLLGGFAKPFGGFAEFLRHPEAGLVADAQVALGGGIILIGGAAKPFDGFLIILLRRPGRSGSRCRCSIGPRDRRLPRPRGFRRKLCRLVLMLAMYHRQVRHGGRILPRRTRTG